jgi:hypothetical protein
MQFSKNPSISLHLIYQNAKNATTALNLENGSHILPKVVISICVSNLFMYSMITPFCNSIPPIYTHVWTFFRGSVQ